MRNLLLWLIKALMCLNGRIVIWLIVHSEGHTVLFGKPSEPSRCWAGSSTTQGPGPAWIRKYTKTTSSINTEGKSHPCVPQVMINTDNTKTPSTDSSYMRKCVCLLFRPAFSVLIKTKSSLFPCRNQPPITVIIPACEWEKQVHIFYLCTYHVAYSTGHEL